MTESAFPGMLLEPASPSTIRFHVDDSGVTT